MASSKSEIISFHPIGSRLEEYRDLYNCFSAEHSDDGADKIEKRLLQLLAVLQTHPVCFELPSGRGHGTLFDDLLALLSEVRSSLFEINRLRPLLKAIHDEQPDETIWNKVYDAVTETTPPPRLPLPLLQTPLLRNTSSFVNSTEYRKHVDAVLKEELGAMMYADIPGFYEKYFGTIEWLEPAAQAVFAKCKEGEDPFYSEETGWRGWPEGAKELDVLQWLSALIDNFIRFFEEYARDQKIQRKLLAQPYQPLEGSTADRKLDIGFVNDSNASEDASCHWSQILVPGELKNDTSYDVPSKAWLDLGRYVREVMTAQDSRSSVLGFTLCRSKMRLWNFDRLGGIASKSFDINKEGFQFVSVILGYLSMSREQLGFDPTIIDSADGSRYIEIERDGQIERLIFDEVVKRAPCVAGRATTCWKAHLDGDESRMPLVIKDSWQYPEREEEGALLREVTEKGVNNVARYYHHETVCVRENDDDICNAVRKGLDVTKAGNYRASGSRPALSRKGSRAGRKDGGSSVTCRKRSSASIDSPLPPSKRQSISPTKAGTHEPMPNRIHRRVVVRDYGKPIYKASSRVSLLAALEGCIEGYEELYKRTGLLQGDISPNNLMINEEADNSSWKSFLIDLDLAIREQREGFSGNRGKTGTLAFMAIGVLLADEKRSFMHDLESFFWVLFWICIHYKGPGEGKVVEEFEKWNFMDTEALAKAKKGEVSDERDFLISAGKYFTEYYQPLVPWVNKLRREVFPGGGRWRRSDPNLGSSMRRILQEARNDPNVIGPN